MWLTKITTLLYLLHNHLLMIKRYKSNYTYTGWLKKTFPSLGCWLTVQSVTSGTLISYTSGGKDFSCEIFSEFFHFHCFWYLHNPKFIWGLLQMSRRHRCITYQIKSCRPCIIHIIKQGCTLNFTDSSDPFKRYFLISAMNQELPKNYFQTV